MQRSVDTQLVPGWAPCPRRSYSGPGAPWHPAVGTGAQPRPLFAESMARSLREEAAQDMSSPALRHPQLSQQLAAGSAARPTLHSPASVGWSPTPSSAALASLDRAVRQAERCASAACASGAARATPQLPRQLSFTPVARRASEGAAAARAQPAQQPARKPAWPAAGQHSAAPAGPSLSPDVGPPSCSQGRKRTWAEAGGRLEEPGWPGALGAPGSAAATAQAGAPTYAPVPASGLACGEAWCLAAAARSPPAAGPP